MIKQKTELPYRRRRLELGKFTYSMSPKNHQPVPEMALTPGKGQYNNLDGLQETRSAINNSVRSNWLTVGRLEGL